MVGVRVTFRVRVRIRIEARVWFKVRIIFEARVRLEAKFIDMTCSTACMRVCIHTHVYLSLCEGGQDCGLDFIHLIVSETPEIKCYERQPFYNNFTIIEKLVNIDF